jgi:hypothetical protein
MKKVRHSIVFIHIVSPLLLFCLLFVASSCEFHAGSSRQLKKQVDSFAVYYFNWQFHKAVRFVTPESEKWMSYAASQVHQADIDLLQQKELPATCEIQEITYDDTLFSAIAHVTIRNYLRMDTIGKEASVIDVANFDIPLSYHSQSDKWIVNINELPRPLKNQK